MVQQGKATWQELEANGVCGPALRSVNTHDRDLLEQFMANKIQG